MAINQPRLVFALDATASREPTWHSARRLHAALFSAAQSGASLAIQLCYYRGLNEFRASPWATDSKTLLTYMNEVTCLGGPTQLTKLLRHYCQAGSATTPVRGLVFVGDACEETPTELINLAGRCRLLNQPLFMFQEGNDQSVASIFREMASVSGGAYAPLNNASASYLGELLGAVARFATGGRLALSRSGRESDKLLLTQMSGHDTQ